MYFVYICFYFCILQAAGISKKSSVISSELEKNLKAKALSYIHYLNIKIVKLYTLAFMILYTSHKYI